MFTVLHNFFGSLSCCNQHYLTHKIIPVNYKVVQQQLKWPFWIKQLLKPLLFIPNLVSTLNVWPRIYVSNTMMKKIQLVFIIDCKTVKKKRKEIKKTKEKKKDPPRPNWALAQQATGTPGQPGHPLPIPPHHGNPNRSPLPTLHTSSCLPLTPPDLDPWIWGAAPTPAPRRP